MIVKKWSQEEIEEYSHNISLLYAKTHELRNQFIEEHVSHVTSHIKTHLGVFFYRVTHFGHKPQLR
jgi:hypothetical protein